MAKKKKNDFANVIKLRALNWEDYPRLLEYAQPNHLSPQKQEPLKDGTIEECSEI